MTDKYQGWANYETWCVHLWLSNEQEPYYEFRDLAENYVNRPYELGQEIKNRVEEETETALAAVQTKMDAYSGMISDIFHANLSVVDWEEIGKAFLED